MYCSSQPFEVSRVVSLFRSWLFYSFLGDLAPVYSGKTNLCLCLCLFLHLARIRDFTLESQALLLENPTAIQFAVKQNGSMNCIPYSTPSPPT